jgi:uncharacterized protein YyaL (SSP411 family)
VVRRLVPVVAALAAAVLAAGAGAANPPPLPGKRQLAADRATFLKIAAQGIAQTRKQWWNPQAGWYMGRLGGNPPVASTWTIFPLFEATNALALASPTRANKQAVEDFALRAEAYWDPTIANGAGGVSWLYGLRNTGNAYFDDTGWWGVAYLDAYRATGDKRWLWDAGRALFFIDRFGWDRAGGGGVWWDVAHSHKTSEPLAAGALIAATLYRVQHRKRFLEIAKRYIAWADAKTRNPQQGGLYGRSDTDKTIMDYVEGMMIAAHVELCAGTKVKAYCTKAERLANAALSQFPIDADWAPETDVVYLRWLLDLYQHDGKARWYAVVYGNAKRALANARGQDNLWELRWDGGWTLPGTLYTQAATLQLFAWTASVKPPT